MTEPRVAGLDGCRAGWVLASAPLPRLDVTDDAVAKTMVFVTHVTVVVIADLDPVVDAIAKGTICAAAIDIPIGLAAREPRRCDREARHLLGPRRSSVFPAPVRGVLAAQTYPEACAISRRASGKAISKQLYNILPKIREVDAALSTWPGLQAHLFEMCPELSFALLAGAPMTHPKRTAPGRKERLHALRAAFGNEEVDTLSASAPQGAAPDDVLDALAGLWTALRHANGASVRIGGVETDGNETDGNAETDETGLRMEVIA